jgi:hypothetical protein
MPVFASVVAYVVIDTIAVLMWHQVLFSRLCRDTSWAACRPLVVRYLQQCSPGPLWYLVNPRRLCRRGITTLLDLPAC